MGNRNLKERTRRFFYEGRLQWAKGICWHDKLLTPTFLFEYIRSDHNKPKSR